MLLTVSKTGGNSQTRPFKTIQSTLIEYARFSYQSGKNNDKIDRTTILVYPGTHYIDNRSGYTIINNNGAAEYRMRKETGWNPPLSVSSQQKLILMY